MSRILIEKWQNVQVGTSPAISWGSEQIETRYRVLQWRLLNVPFCGPLVKEICSQLLAEELVDMPDIQPFINSPDEQGKEDLRKIVLMFMNRKSADVYKFLSILMNITNFPAASKSFQNVIQEVVLFPNECELSPNKSTSDLLNRRDRFVPMKRSLSSLSVVSSENGEVKMREGIEKSKEKEKHRSSCSDWLIYESAGEDFKGNKRTKVSQNKENNGPLLSNKQNNHVSIEMPTNEDNSISNQALETKCLEATNQEGEPLVSPDSQEILNRPKKKAKSRKERETRKESRVKTALKLIGVALGLGAVSWTSTSYSLSNALTGNTSLNTSNTTRTAWQTRVSPMANLDEIAVIERKVNDSYYKYGFAK